MIRSLKILTLALTLSLALAPRAEAQTLGKKIYAELGTLLSSVSLAAAEGTRTTTAVQTLAFNQLVLFVHYTRATATTVDVTCRVNYDLSDTTNYKYLSWDCADPNLCIGETYTRRVNVSGSDAWIIPFPWMGSKITCIFSGTGAGAGDLITVKALGGVL